MNNKIYEKIKEEIKNIPLIDVHSHLDLISPQAKSLEDIIFYHFIRREFYSAGGDDNFFVSSASLEEKIDHFLKYYPLIENTINIWCIKKIFEDIYKIKKINKDTLMKIQKKIQVTKDIPDYPEKILTEKLKIQKIFCCKGWNGDLENYQKEKRSNFEVLLEGLSFGPILGKGLLEFITEKRTKNFKESKEKFISILGRIIKNKYKALGIAFDYLFEYVPYDINSLENLFNKYLKNEDLNYNDFNKIMSYFLDETLNSLKGKSLTLQIYLGALWGFGIKELNFRYGESFTIYSPSIVPSLIKIFKTYDGINFNIYNCNLNLSQELTIMARMLPNVSLVGFWWHNLYPVYIEKIISERLEVLPLNKWIFLATDAYCCEWSYGKYSLVMDCLLRVLTEKMEKKHLTLKKIKEICWYTFYNNPVQIYHLKNF